MSSICTVPPSGRRRVSERTTASVSLATTSRTREDAALWLPSTARKALVMATEIFSGSKVTTAPLRRMTWSAASADSLLAERARTFEDTTILRDEGRRIESTQPAPGERYPGSDPLRQHTQQNWRTATHIDLSSGTPRPIVDWKDVAAGLLALGSGCFTRLPGLSQWHWVAKHSPITVAGAA